MSRRQNSRSLGAVHWLQTRVPGPLVLVLVRLFGLLNLFRGRGFGIDGRVCWGVLLRLCVFVSLDSRVACHDQSCTRGPRRPAPERAVTFSGELDLNPVTTSPLRTLAVDTAVICMAPPSRDRERLRAPSGPPPIRLGRSSPGHAATGTSTAAHPPGLTSAQRWGRSTFYYPQKPLNWECGLFRRYHWGRAATGVDRAGRRVCRGHVPKSVS